MDPELKPAPDGPDAVRSAFAEALAGFNRSAPVLVMGHFDADGLSALAILVRALEADGRETAVRIVGKGENPWSDAMRAELAPQRLGGIIATDLGVRRGAIRAGTPTIVIDHHVPTGEPTEATVITGHGMDPIPTSSLLAYWCAGALTDAEPLLWLAAIGLIGDMAEGAGFAELADAQRRYGKTALREAVSLLNAPRRAAAADAGPSLALLLKGAGPKDVTSGVHSETAVLRAAKAEVAAELDLAKRAPPKVRGAVAMIAFHSPCQIHPLIAQQWRGRLKVPVILAANTGYRPGWVHFAARSGTDADLIAFLAEHRPPGADENYGSGHRQATGGALRIPDWNAFVTELGFPEYAVSQDEQQAAA